MKVEASPRKKQTSKCNKFRFRETECHRTKTGPNLHSRVHEQNSTQSPSSTKITNQFPSLVVPVHSLLQERSNLISRELIWWSGLSAALEFQWPQLQVLLWPAAGFVPGYRLWCKSSLALVRNPLLFLLPVGVLYLLSCLFYYGPEKPQRGVVNEVNMHTH